MGITTIIIAACFYVLPAVIVSFSMLMYIKHKNTFVSIGEVLGVSLVSLTPALNIIISLIYIHGYIEIWYRDSELRKFLNKKAF